MFARGSALNDPAGKVMNPGAESTTIGRLHVSPVGEAASEGLGPTPEGETATGAALVTAGDAEASGAACAQPTKSRTADTAKAIFMIEKRVFNQVVSVA